MQKFNMAAQNVARSSTVSEINMFLHFRHCEIQKVAITPFATEVHL